MGVRVRTVAGEHTGDGGGRKRTEVKGVRKGSAGAGERGRPGREIEEEGKGGGAGAGGSPRDEDSKRVAASSGEKKVGRNFVNAGRPADELAG